MGPQMAIHTWCPSVLDDHTRNVVETHNLSVDCCVIANDERSLSARGVEFQRSFERLGADHTYRKDSYVSGKLSRAVYGILLDLQQRTERIGVANVTKIHKVP